MVPLVRPFLISCSCATLWRIGYLSIVLCRVAHSPSITVGANQTPRAVLEGTSLLTRCTVSVSVLHVAQSHRPFPLRQPLTLPSLDTCPSYCLVLQRCACRPPPCRRRARLRLSARASTYPRSSIGRISRRTPPSRAGRATWHRPALRGGKEGRVGWRGRGYKMESSVSISCCEGGHYQT